MLYPSCLWGLDVRSTRLSESRVFNETHTSANWDTVDPSRGMDEAALYEHALGFLDRFIDEAAQRGLELRHRLDAQSVAWAIQDPPSGTNDPTEVEDDDQPQDGPDLHALAGDVYLPVEFLEEIETLLEEKKQVIFQGPPGTGKTFVAQKLAACLAGPEERVTLVQFHPSYAYEDFVEGFRPTLENGQPGFKLRKGPLLRAAERARNDSEADHYLIIDEINRGNIAKVFGELYFLLEYRNREMTLQYSEEPFSLPAQSVHHWDDEHGRPLHSAGGHGAAPPLLLQDVSPGRRAGKKRSQEMDRPECGRHGVGGRRG